jgi:2-oxoglutarate ferredoxin oxidoreductase subunit gamma
MNRAEIKIAGFGGQGVIMAGIILGKAASIFDRFHATMIQSFGPEARGSACAAQLIVDENPIAYPYIKTASFLVAFNQDAYELFGPQLRPDGTLIYEEDMVKLHTDRPTAWRTYAIPATRIAEEIGRSLYQNVVMLGAFAAITGWLSYESVEKAVKDSIPRGTEEVNLKALKRGYDHARALLPQSAPATV